ncbi:hypothetical protein [Brevundimonas sp.]
MRSLLLSALALTSALVAVPGAATAQSKPQAYEVVPVAPDERSGRSREIQCSVGQMAETTCTFTPCSATARSSWMGRAWRYA